MKKNLAKKLTRGFTLLEMIVVIAIVVIMTGIILANLPSMSSGISVDLVAQETAIYIRSAQTYTSAVKASASGEFYNTFGLHFIKNSKNFVLFVDNDKGGYGEESEGVKIQERYTLPGDFFVKNLIGNESSGSNLTPDELDVVFIRPQMKASFFSGTSGTDCDANRLTSCNWASAKICVGSSRASDVTRVVTIYNNGQIAVSNESCL